MDIGFGAELALSFRRFVLQKVAQPLLLPLNLSTSLNAKALLCTGVGFGLHLGLPSDSAAPESNSFQKLLESLHS